ncbi:MAG: tetratricopeptide repeat protein, partial [Dysgonamonadaceae bacterium]|nr:tetratricopeptide repeat protein [Dysgonamonadaceae bacterium]
MDLRKIKFKHLCNEARCHHRNRGGTVIPRMRKIPVILCFAATLLAASLSAQNREAGTEEWRRSLPNKPYAEACDSLRNFLNRIESVPWSEEEEVAAWHSLKDYAVRYRDRKLEQLVDFFFIHIYRYKYVHLYERTIFELYHELAERAERIQHVELQVTCLHSLANRYFEMQNYEASFTLYKKIEPLLESLPDGAFPDKVDIYQAMGDIFYWFREYETAAAHLKKAVRLPVSYWHRRGRAAALNTLGLCFIQTNLPDSAEVCFRTIVDEDLPYAER